jgi:L-lysine 2,3-aminomutase
MMTPFGMLFFQGAILSTILRGINDDVDTLKAMYETLVSHRTVSYYAIWGILARGIRHFAVTGEEARDLMRKLENNTSGFCIPHLSTLNQQNNKVRTIG